jgi:hypothetical protein
VRTGEFTETTAIIDDVLFAQGGEISAVDEAVFIDEIERAHYLRGDGPIFALYETIAGLQEQAKREGRLLSPEERADVAPADFPAVGERVRSSSRGRSARIHRHDDAGLMFPVEQCFCDFARERR